MRNEPLTNTTHRVSEIEEQIERLDGAINSLSDELEALFDRIRPVTKTIPQSNKDGAIASLPIPDAPQSSIGVAIGLLRSKTARILSEVATVKANLAI